MRARWFRVLAVGVAALAWDAGGVSARAAQPFVTGVNVANPQWMEPAKRDAIFGQLIAAGVKVVRLPFIPPTGSDDAGAVEMIRAITARGLGVHLILYCEYPADAPRRPAVSEPGEMWPLPPLSAARADLFAARFGPVLKRFDELGVKLAGIELDNEINWAAFNGSFPVPGPGRVMGFDDLDDDPLGRQIADGYRSYIRTAAALKRLRDGLTLNRATPIIAAGFAERGLPGPRPGAVAGAVSVPATMRWMRLNGLDAFVDAYGVHSYSEVGVPTAARRKALAEDALAECRPPREGRPCWLTEWGVPDPREGCPAPDAPREAAIRELRTLLSGYRDQGRLAAAMVYQWNGGRGDAFAIHRCGSLTPSGRLAIEPF